MNKRSVPRKKPGLSKILTFFLLAVLALNLLAFFSRLSSEMHGGYVIEYSDMARTVKSHDYPQLEMDLLHNQTHNARPQQNTAQFALLAEYYHAAQLFRAYLGANDTAKAETLLERMKELEQAITEPDVLVGFADLQQRYPE